MGAFAKLQTDFFLCFLIVLYLYANPAYDGFLWGVTAAAVACAAGWMCRAAAGDYLGPGLGAAYSYPVVVLATALAWSAARTPAPLPVHGILGVMAGGMLAWMLPVPAQSALYLGCSTE